MDSELGRCLSDTLSPDPNVRIKAELRVNELTQHPETAITLASILSYDQVDISLRQHSSGIVLRKYIREHWSPYFGSFKGSAPPPEAKDVVRTTIFRCLSDPLSKIRSAAANILSLIANSDWPDSYPDLLNNLLTLLSSNSSHAVHGAMQVFSEFAKDDLTEDQLLPVLRQLLPVLLNILGDRQHHSPVTRARSVSVFRQCLQALYMVKEEHPQAIKEAIEGILPEWIEAFKVLLSADLNQEISEGGQWDALLIRIQIFKTLDVINTAFNRSLKPYANSLLDISLHHLQALLPAFQRYYVDLTGTAPTSTEDEEITIPRLAAPLIDFVSNLCKRSSTKGWFETNSLTSLVEIVFHWIQMTGEDEELWANNPNAFIAQEDDESQEYSLRIAGLDFLSDLLDRYPAHTTRALQAATQQLIETSNFSRQRGSSEWWRPLEAALAALGAVSPSVIDILQGESSQGSKPFDIEALLLNVVPPLLSLPEYPFLQGRGFVFASQYAKCLTAPLAEQYLNAALEVLESVVPGTAVKVSAVKAIRNFSSQVEESIVVNLAPRIIRDLGPFLTTTTEDTLTLVLETISVVVEVGEGKWLDPELVRLLSQAALDVWTRNIKDPILLSVLEDLLTELADSHAPVYEAVVTQCLPALCDALARPNSEQPFIANSAIDLIAALAQGARRGALGDGFFAAFAPQIFALLRDSQDSGLLESAIVLLTLVIRKDASQVISWTDSQNQTGLTNVLLVIGRVLTPSEQDTGGLVVGDLIIHLLRNSGDSIVPSLPDLIRALVNRMTTAKTVTLSQSLITPVAFLIYSHRDSVLDVLGSFTVDNVQPPKTGLEVFVSSWMENAEGLLQGVWSHRISDLAICSILSSNRADLFNIPVKGDLIIKPETANVIMTRSKTKNSPHQYQYIPFVVKALKQLLQDFNDNEHSETKRGDAGSEDGNSEWADSDEEGGELIQGLKKEEYAYLSELLGGKSGFDEDDESSGGLDDDDLKDDPVYTMDIKAHLGNFISQLTQQAQFRPVIDQLNAQEMLIIRRIVDGK